MGLDFLCTLAVVLISFSRACKPAAEGSFLSVGLK